jgi:hypothetical protein
LIIEMPVLSIAGSDTQHAEGDKMGISVSDSATRDVIAQINARFEAGEAIEEMVALQGEFKIFSPDHSLYQSWLLLNIKASDPAERSRWKHWTEVYLKTLSSDMAGVNGHDRLVKAYQDNLEGSKPLPMFYRHHLHNHNDQVVVSIDKGPLFSTADHVVTSIPIIPA